MTGSQQQATAGETVLPRLRSVLPALCIAQTTSWGVVYYAFPVLRSDITADTGWSATSATAAFSLALLVSALTGILVGRILDRRGPHLVMTAGSVLAVTAVSLVAVAPNYAFFVAAWMLAGVGMATTFYPPAFAALTRWFGDTRVRALTILTLAGGLASTVFAPVTSVLSAHLDWRSTYLTLAAILAVVTVPAHALALRAPWPPAVHTATDVSGDRRSVARTRAFLLLAVALTLAVFSMYAVVIALIPLLTTRGASPATAAWALGLSGAGQTLGRTLYATLARHTAAALRTCILLVAGAAALVALAVVPGPVPLLILLAVAVGMVRGNLTLLQATAVPDRWGTTQYGRLSGLLLAPVTTASAVAPFAGTALAGPLGGYPNVFVALAIISAVAALLALGTRPRTRPHDTVASP